MIIDKDTIYTSSELAKILKLEGRTAQLKLINWEIKAKNIGTEKKKIFRIQWKDILDYLNK